ncbi:MAG: BatD family protein [Fibrobacteria bacterium]
MTSGTRISRLFHRQARARALALLCSVCFLALGLGMSRAHAADAPVVPSATPGSGNGSAAAAGSLDISSQVDRSEITIGDRIQYEIKVVYPAEGRVELPSVLGNLGSFEVKEYQASDPKDAGKLRIQTWHFDLSTFTVGKYTIPPQQIAYRHGADTAAIVYFTQPIEINVIRTSPETVKDIADIAALAEVPSGPPWLAYGLGASVLLALAWFLWRKLRRKPSTAADTPALPPYEEAMARIAGLKDLALIRQNRAREFCFVLSESLRRYLSRRYGIDALESTTSEFVAKIKTLPITGAQKQWLAKTSEDGDLVKFASAQLLESEAAAMVAQTVEFLSQTKPRDDEPAQSPKADGGGSTFPGLPTGKSGMNPGQKNPLQKEADPGAAPSAKPASKPAAKPKGPGPGPGYTQGGHGHDSGSDDKGWVA